MLLDKKYHGVLFDLDGTLLDTANDLGEALNYVLQQHNMPTVAREKYRPIASDGAKGLLTLGFGDKLSLYDFDSLRQEFLDYYQENIAVHTCLYPGISELLCALNEQQTPWGIVTNKPEGLTKLLLPFFDDLNQCKTMVAGDTLAQRKPHPAPLFYACEQLSIQANKCIYVGDAPRDIEAGNRADMYTIIAKWGYILDHSLCASWQADLMVEKPLDILFSI